MDKVYGEIFFGMVFCVCGYFVSSEAKGEELLKYTPRRMLKTKKCYESGSQDEEMSHICYIAIYAVQVLLRGTSIRIADECGSWSRTEERKV